MAGVFVYLVLGLRHRYRGRPFPREGRRVVDREFVLDRARIGAREALDQAHAFRRPPETDLVGEVRRIDDERRAFPAAARITEPLPDLWSDMRTAVERDDARVVNHLVENHDISRRLENLVIVVVRTGNHWQPERDAALPEAPVFP